MEDEVQKRIRKLRETVDRHRHLYHVKDKPEISDAEYDALYSELEELETKHPELQSDTSPTQRIGGEPAEAFEKVEHVVPQWSFDNIFDRDELVAWDEKIKRFAVNAQFTADEITYACEAKIDGFKIVLTYEGGKLITAATRGNGRVGENVTSNVRTIQSIPLDLYKDVDLVVGGEIWLSHTEFARVNKDRIKSDEEPFANPRNAAAGTIRQLDPQIAADRHLDSFIYDVDEIKADDPQFTTPRTQMEALELLEKLGFKVNPHHKLCKSIDDVQEFYDQWIDQRDKQDYEVDGIVIKVDQRDIQDALGHTATAPRFAVAYKFPAETTTTTIEDITLQVGRTGTITPVAELASVKLAGSNISRATLHNADEIERLDVRVGDTVVIKKAGDVIPNVVRVVEELRDGSQKPFKFPRKIAQCGGDGSIYRPEGEVKHRCKEAGSGEQQRQKFYYFVSNKAFDIDGLGPKIVDQLLDENLINSYDDIFTLEKGDVLELERMAEKSADNLIESINKAREITLWRFLVSLSIDYVGSEMSRRISNHFGSIEKIRNASVEELEEIDGVGPNVAQAVVAWFSELDNQGLVDDLLAQVDIENPPAREKKESSVFSGKTVVFTGSLDSITRAEAEEAVRVRGGNPTSSVSKSTDYVVAGDNPGSKLERAREFEIEVLDEEEFNSLLAE